MKFLSAYESIPSKKKYIDIVSNKVSNKVSK